MNDMLNDPLKEVRLDLEKRIDKNVARQQLLFDELEVLQKHEKKLREALRRVVGNGDSDETGVNLHTPSPEAKTASTPPEAKFTKQRSGSHERRKQSAAKRVLRIVQQEMPPKFTTATFVKCAKGSIGAKPAADGLSGLRDQGYLTLEREHKYQGKAFWVKTNKLDKLR